MRPVRPSVPPIPTTSTSVREGESLLDIPNLSRSSMGPHWARDPWPLCDSRSPQAASPPVAAVQHSASLERKTSTRVFASSAMSREPGMSGIQSGFAMPPTVVAMATGPPRGIDDGDIRAQRIHRRFFGQRQFRPGAAECRSGPGSASESRSSPAKLPGRPVRRVGRAKIMKDLVMIESF